MLALITGASSGIGKATAIQFAAQGYDLILAGRRRERLEALKEELVQKHTIRVLTLELDVRQQPAVQAAIEHLPEDFKAIDILVNNAGLAAGLGPIQDGEIDKWDRMIDTNIKGLLYVTKAVMPLMIARKQGHIINIGSIAGKEVYPNGNVYCATKHAVDALNKSMRIDLLPHGIKVTAVNPGMVETEFSIVRFDGDQEKAGKVYQGLQPLMAEDIAETIVWVASRPKHVNINDVVIMPSVQATATNVIRES